MTQRPGRNRRLDSPSEKAKTESPGERQRRLRQISRARSRLMVCFLTLPVYMVGVWMLLNNQQSTDSFMFMYMAVWAGFAVDMARRRCPKCGEQFYVKIVFLNLLTRRCVHCGLSTGGSDDNDQQRLDA